MCGTLRRCHPRSHSLPLPILQRLPHRIPVIIAGSTGGEQGKFYRVPEREGTRSLRMLAYLRETAQSRFTEPQGYGSAFLFSLAGSPGGLMLCVAHGSTCKPPLLGCQAENVALPAAFFWFLADAVRHLSSGCAPHRPRIKEAWSLAGARSEPVAVLVAVVVAVSCGTSSFSIASYCVIRAKKNPRNSSSHGLSCRFYLVGQEGSNLRVSDWPGPACPAPEW